jgi:5'-nucleotidase
MDASNKINRRGFLKTGAKLGALSMLSEFPLSALAKPELIKVTLLHTNDWHSRIDAFPKDGGKYAGMGGAATRAALIKKIRAEEEHIILLDAGDIFQGTPYFNFFEGELEYKLMSEMGYDAATLGNHDFDNGIEGIINQLQHAKFELLNCNYDFSRTLLADKVKPYRIFKKGGIKIGVIGVGIELEELVPNELFGEIVYHNPVDIADKLAKELKTQKACDLVICLSHLGFEYQNDKLSDKKLAQKTAYIDVIVGGHTHTFLPKPIVIKNQLNKEVIINQVGWAGLQLGKIDFYFDSARSIVNTSIGKNMYINHKES